MATTTTGHQTITYSVSNRKVSAKPTKATFSISKKTYHTHAATCFFGVIINQFRLGQLDTCYGLREILRSCIDYTK